MASAAMSRPFAWRFARVSIRADVGRRAKCRGRRWVWGRWSSSTPASAWWGDPSPAAGVERAGGPPAGPDARLSGAQHRLHRTLEWDVSSALGALGAQDASSGASQGGAACGDGSGRSPVQLLHRACEPAAGERAGADTSDGGGDHGSLLVGEGVVVAPRAAATLAAAHAARAALQGNAGVD